MKKTLSLIVALCLAGSLAGCVGGTTAPSGSSAPATPPADNELSAAIAGKINVSCYDTMLYKDALEAAAALFEEKYPGTKVHIDTFSTMPEMKTMEKDGMTLSIMENGDDPQSRADYLNKINTALMSGGGPDLLAMDILPTYRYAENGQLEALDSYMSSDPDFRPEDYRQNILEAAKYEDKTWFLPADYGFDYLAFDSSLLAADQAETLKNADSFTYRELFDSTADSFAADKGAQMFNLGSGEEVFGRLLDESYGQFVNPEAKTANFADGSFAALLESTKAYLDKGYVPSHDPISSDSDDVDLFSMVELDHNQKFYYKPQNYMSLMQALDKSDSGISMVFGAGGGNSDNDVLGGIQANTDGKVPFTFSQGYAMNANSGNKRTAWEFLKFLLSEEAQMSPTSFGLPVNNAARAKKAEMTIDGSLFGADIPMDEGRKQLLADYKATVESYSDRINCHLVRDSAIDDMITAEVKYYFDGSKTAGEVAQVLQSKVDLYLGE